MKKKLLSLFMVAMLLVLGVTATGSHVGYASGSGGSESYDPGDGSRWYYNQDFTKITVDGVEYDNLVITFRQNGGRVRFLNAGVAPFLQAEPYESVFKSYPHYGQQIMYAHFEKWLKTIADYSPCFELLTINHVPWQDTEYAALFIEFMLNSTDRGNKNHNPYGYTSEELVEFIMDKDNLGYLVPMYHHGYTRSESTPVGKAYIIPHPYQGLAPSESKLEEFGGLNSDANTVVPIPYDEFMSSFKPAGPKDPEHIVMYIGLPKIQKGDTVIELDVNPYIKGSSTLIPLRGAMEALDAKVHWNAKDDSVRVVQGDNVILFAFGKMTALVNGVSKPLPVALERSGDRIMLPLRFLSESLKYRVDWYGDTQKIVVSK